ncbi:two-component regulator propeller domain-containing protein [Flammeovirga aprica]|uniref:SpoIIE family protein phosphatase n=1 Tax=Flammeovirga aprica JL-4 TaxID=694437 RepID=A0A7X9RRC8_9BACT|nr:two-component regulator propeller domain-containing protein [Flammeovirga aprica]NME67728.1 SpoIIE family protein phosphatase [Flammeovirga aprica JL-4]
MTKALLYIAVLFIVFQANAQQYNITKFTINNGLVQNNCVALQPGKYGSIIIGTIEGGININNSQSFYTIDSKKGLSNNFIFDFANDENKNVWVATANGVNLLSDRKVSNFLINDSIPFGVRNIDYNIKNKEVWGITTSFDLFLLNPKFNKKTFHYPLRKNTKYSCISTDTLGNMWIGTIKEGVLIVKDEKVKRHIRLPGNIKTIQHLKNDKVAIGTDNGVWILHNDQNKPPVRILNRKKILSLFESKDGMLWVGTRNNGAYVFQDEKEIRHLNYKNGLDRHINSICEDEEHGIWFATPNGLFRLNNDIYTFFGKGVKINGKVLDTYQWKNNTLFVGTENEIILLKDEKFSKKIELPVSVRYLNMIENFEDHLIIGTDKGVFRYSNNQWVKLTDPSHEEFLNSPTSFFKKNGKLYAVLINHIFEVTDSSLEYVKDYSKDLRSSRVSKIVISPKDSTLWLGTRGRGLIHINNDFEIINTFQPNNKSLPSNYVNDLVFDQLNNLWIGTTGSGLCKLHEGADMAISFQDEKLSSTNIYSVEVDKKGNIWAGSNNGINHLVGLNNDIVKVEKYGTAEGFNSLSYTKSSASKDKNGNLWFGTDNGVVKINPIKSVYSMVPPVIVFEELQMFSEYFPWEDYSDGLDKETQLPINLQLPSNYNHITINFVGISMNVPSKIRYKWKLIGYEEYYHPLTENSQAIYSNLPPGDYIFSLQAVNARGIASPINEQFQFTIEKKFFQKRSVRAIITILIIVFIFYLFYSSLRKERIKKETLQQKVDERTQEFRNEREKVEKAKNEIEKKSNQLREINDRMQGSIKYAANIQDAIISCDGTFPKLFPKSFNLSITKSEVTGDFIWIRENSKYIFLLLIDCTNHGVPAAFISIVGNQLLDELVRDNPNIRSADLLTKLDQNLKIALKIHENNEISDGMDVAVCRFEKGTRNLNFAGARRPLIIIENGELKTIKSNFCSIGIIFNDVKPEFDNFDFELSEDAILYLFSDGFSSQFNAKGEKFKKVQFKNLLFELSSLPFTEQCNTLYSTFHKWKEGIEQGDDMMVVGFKYETNYAESKRDHKIIRETERIEGD